MEPYPGRQTLGSGSAEPTHDARGAVDAQVYEPPMLQRLGTLAEMTAGPGGAGTDGLNGGSALP